VVLLKNYFFCKDNNLIGLAKAQRIKEELKRVLYFWAKAHVILQYQRSSA
jgi:hypothetical protein